jgi:hypothetical protein
VEDVLSGSGRQAVDLLGAAPAQVRLVGAGHEPRLDKRGAVAKSPPLGEFEVRGHLGAGRLYRYLEELEDRLLAPVHGGSLSRLINARIDNSAALHRRWSW